MYKLIALDMDGTLLKDDKSISKENYTAIQNAKKKGVKVVLATGRPIMGIKRYLEELKLISDTDYAVVFNGALVQSTKSKNILAKNFLSVDDIKILYDLSKKLHVNIHSLTLDGCITPKTSKYTLLECKNNNMPLKEVDFNNVPKDTTIVKIMFIDEPEILDKAIENIPKEFYDKYTIVKSSAYFLEFINKKVTKGEGVKLLADKLNIDMKDVICMGDHNNDVEMVDYAGLGVAMGNGTSDIKDVANFVTKTNEENGVAYAINKFVLNN